MLFRCDCFGCVWRVVLLTLKKSCNPSDFVFQSWIICHFRLQKADIVIYSNKFKTTSEQLHFYRPSYKLNTGQLAYAQTRQRTTSLQLVSSPTWASSLPDEGEFTQVIHAFCFSFYCGNNLSTEQYRCLPAGNGCGRPDLRRDEHTNMLDDSGLALVSFWANRTPAASRSPKASWNERCKRSPGCQTVWYFFSVNLPQRDEKWWERQAVDAKALPMTWMMTIFKHG